METVAEPNKPQPLTEAAANRVAIADKRLANLDLLRGIAALLVCAGHLRAFLFVDYAHVIAPNIFVRAFYFITGLGHQAVVIFFVLSGYLVGGSVLAAYESGRWSWMKYASRRMTRLWVVLLPALLLTFTLDTMGRHWAPTGYAGELRNLYNSGPTMAQPTDLRVSTFFGNAFFLQTIRVNCFGTNGPLWSLANEFWYYGLFPLLCSIIFSFRRPTAFRHLTSDLRSPTSGLWSRGPVVLLSSLLFAVLLWWLPRNITWSGLIWLIGVGVYGISHCSLFDRIFANPIALVVAGVSVVACLAASKTQTVFGSDLVLGLVVGLLVLALIGFKHHLKWLKGMGYALSEMSYTLYLVHFPLLVFIFFCCFQGKQFQPAGISLLYFGSLLGLSITFGAVIWWLFERNTDSIRRHVEASRVWGAIAKL